MPSPSIATHYPVTPPAISRNVTIAASVVLFHALALWALQTGLLRRMAEMVVPAEILVEIMAPATPQSTTPPVPKPPTPVIAPPRPAPVAKPAVVVAPTPLAVLESAPSPQAVAPAPVAAPTPTSAAPVAAAPATTAVTAAPPKIDLPSSDADYLHNPKPPYPPLSKRLGEQGKVVVRTLIGVDGTAQKAEIKQSSGFDRLDQAALATALRWRYVPGKRAGVPEAMWFNVPFSFVLE